MPAASTIRPSDGDDELGFADDSDSTSKTPLEWAGSDELENFDNKEELAPITLDGISEIAKNKQSFSVKCKVCDSRIYVAPSSIGKEVECPDCYTKIVVPKPKKKKKDTIQEHSKAIVPKNQLTTKPEKDAFADLGIDDEPTEVDASFGFAPVTDDLLAPPPKPEWDEEVEEIELETCDEDDESEAKGRSNDGGNATSGGSSSEPDDIQIDDPFEGSGELLLESLDNLPDKKSVNEAAKLTTDDLLDSSEGEASFQDLSLEPELELPPEILHPATDWEEGDPSQQSPEVHDDEEIELIDESPEIANRQATFAPKLKADGDAKEKSGKKKKRKRKAKPVQRVAADDEDDDLGEPPERAHAAGKKRRKKKKKADRDPTKLSGDEEFPSFENYEWFEPAKSMIRSGGLTVWASIAAVLLAIGNGAGYQLKMNLAATEDPTMGTTMFNWVMWIGLGALPFVAGCLLLWLICSVIFREAAMGQTSVEGFKISAISELQPTFLAFAFPFFIGGLPMLLFRMMFLSIPVRFFLGSIFLLAAWFNRSPFQIISTEIFNSASSIGSHWKNYLLAVFLLSAVGMLGAGLMFLQFFVVVWIGSVIGAVIVTIATMLYAAITGWHCGYVTSSLDQQA